MKLISEFFFFVLVFISAQIYSQESPKARMNAAAFIPAPEHTLACFRKLW